METIAPPVFLSSAAAAWAKNKGAFKLEPSKSSHASSLNSPIGVGKKDEALLTMAEDGTGRSLLESFGIAGWVQQGPEDTELMIDLIDTLKEPRQ